MWISLAPTHSVWHLENAQSGFTEFNTRRKKWVSTGINGHGYGLGVALLALSYQHLCGF